MAPDVSIAVVNNEPALLEALKFNLERSGYRVRAYGNSADALPFSMADLLRRVKLIVEKRMSERRAGTP